MAAQVVDLLEMVDIDHQHRGGRPEPLEAQEFPLGRLDEGAAVEQRGQRIGPGQLLKLGGQAHPVGDVTHHDQPAPVAQGRHRHGHGKAGLAIAAGSVAAGRGDSLGQHLGLGLGDGHPEIPHRLRRCLGRRDRLVSLALPWDMVTTA